MKEYKKIESTKNESIKDLIKLIEKRSYRKETSLFVVEGEREILRAIEYGFIIDRIYFYKEVLSSSLESILNQVSYNQVVEVNESIFKKISVREDSCGMVVVFKEKKLEYLDIDKIIKSKTNPIVLIVESVEKPGNLGAILRSCDGVGVDAVVINSSVDYLGANCIRSSLGASFSIPIVELSLEDSLRLCKDNGLTIVSTSPSASDYYFDKNMKKPVAIVVGSEAWGISEFWFKNADELVKIPMLNTVDSLNVSVATAVILYEIRRQRILDNR